MVFELFNKFKDELFKKFYEADNQLSTKQSLLKNENELKFKEYTLRIDKFNSRIDEIEKFTNINKVRLEKIDDMAATQREASDKLITHGIKLNGLHKEIKESCSKYDKIYLENLFIPGIIGDHCRFKNNREYVEFNLNNLTSLINLKEKSNADLKLTNLKVDSMSKSISSQFDYLEKELKSYSQVLVEQCDKNFKFELNTINQKLQDMKIENHRYAIDLKNTANDLKVDYEKLTNIKNEMYIKLDILTNNLKQQTKTINENLEKIKEDNEKINKKINKMSENDSKFKKSTGVASELKNKKRRSRILVIDSSKTELQSNYNSVERKTSNEGAIRTIVSKINKKVYPQDIDEDFSDVNSVLVNEVDLVEPNSKKQPTDKGVNQLTTTNKKETNLTIKENPEENDLEEEKLFKNKAVCETMDNYKVNTISNGYDSAHSEIVNNFSKPIDKLFEKKLKKSYHTESVEIKKKGNAINNSNDLKLSTEFATKLHQKFSSGKLLSDKVKVLSEETKLKINQSPDNILFTNLLGENRNTTRILPSVNLLKEAQNLGLNNHIVSDIKNDIIARLTNLEKKIAYLEATYKLSFDQLLNQLKNYIPLSVLNPIINKSKGIKIETNENNISNKLSINQNISNTTRKHNQNYLNNHTFSINILDPSSIFKSIENESNNKKNAINIKFLKKTISKKINDSIPKEAAPNSYRSREEFTGTLIRAKSNYGKKKSKEKENFS